MNAPVVLAGHFFFYCREGGLFCRFYNLLLENLLLVTAKYCMIDTEF